MISSEERKVPISFQLYFLYLDFIICGAQDEYISTR